MTVQDGRQPQYATYTTLDHEILDLSVLPRDQRAYFARCYEAYRAGMAWEEFTHLSVGPSHPLLRETDGVITRAVYDHPLFRATHDLEDRLAILQGEMAANPGDDIAHDPVTGEPIGQAAAAQPAAV